jgi:hypothetical protein
VGHMVAEQLTRFGLLATTVTGRAAWISQVNQQAVERRQPL